MIRSISIFAVCFLYSFYLLFVNEQEKWLHGWCCRLSCLMVPLFQVSKHRRPLLNSTLLKQALTFQLQSPR